MSDEIISPASLPQKKKYVRAVGPRLRWLLYGIFGLFAILSANSVYLGAITFLEWFKGDPNTTYQNYFYMVMFGGHLVLGLLIMVSYHKVLEFGEAYASTTGMASAPMLWGTFALFTAGTAALFLRTDSTAGATPIQRLEEFWISGAGLIASLFRPSKSSA